MKQHFDFIIVGQGLAGTILAHDLEEKGNQLLLIDSNESASASRVAAGLINPVGMKRCIPSWGAEVFYPYAIRRYQDLEAKMNASFLAQRSIFKLFGNEEDAHKGRRSHHRPPYWKQQGILVQPFRSQPSKRRHLQREL